MVDIAKGHEYTFAVKREERRRSVQYRIPGTGARAQAARPGRGDVMSWERRSTEAFYLRDVVLNLRSPQSTRDRNLFIYGSSVRYTVIDVSVLRRRTAH